MTTTNTKASKGKSISLIPFSKAALNLQVKILFEAQLKNSCLEVSFEIECEDMTTLDLPSVVEIPQRKMQLWESSCFEFFLKPTQKNCYWEFNLSPDRNWNCLKLNSYRNLEGEEAQVKLLDIQIEESSLNLFRLKVTFDLKTIPELYQTIQEDKQFKIGPAAILKTKKGRLTYWANSHSQDEPDFHNKRNFAFWKL